jgi:hypothetical protein
VLLHPTPRILSFSSRASTSACSPYLFPIVVWRDLVPSPTHALLRDAHITFFPYTHILVP